MPKRPHSELTTDVVIGEEEFEATVEYTVTGSYRPMRHTRYGWDPPESPELEVLAVKVTRDGITEDVQSQLSTRELNRIDELCWEQAQDEADDARAERADEDREERRHER